MKLRLVRLNPLTLDPGEMFIMCGRQIAGNPVTGEALKFVQFPVRLEYSVDNLYGGAWQPVEFVNEFAQPNEDNNAREVRPEVQVPVYNGSTRNKRGGGDQGGGTS